MKTNLIKKTFVLLMTIMFVSVAVLGQSKGKPPRVPDSEEIETMVNKLARDISLSPDQKSEILNLYKNHFEEVKEKMEQERDKQKVEREKMAEHREAFKDEVKSLLNEEQQDKFDEFMKNHRPKNKNRSRK
ncbi:MAG: hypothetical protein R3250_00740 [Melioribacteraceae bacterium]|nr:hypothetical protein [Melioribacteraceae bacterium]